MKKSTSILMVVIILIVVAGGGYALLHKSDKKTADTAAANQNVSQSNASAVNNAILITKTDSKLGQYLADPSGKALYTYDGDSSGVSNCTGSCLATWPAYQDTGSTSNLPAGVGTIKRSDNGQTQYTYNGMPLYYFVSDSGGKVSGDGVENFKIAKPAAASSSSSQPSSSSTPNSSSSSSSSSSYPSY
jgi:predicted lipoprotein with Yx(FWY)xxD motif